MRVSPGRAIAIAVVIGGATAPRPARAQAFDFATCSTATTAATTCTATTGSCCTLPATAGADLLGSGTDHALVIPLDYATRMARRRPANRRRADLVLEADQRRQLIQVYGLVYRLMQNGIPVYWVVNPSKDPPALGSQLPGASVEIPTDIDMWVMDSAATMPPAPGPARDLLRLCAAGQAHEPDLDRRVRRRLGWTYDKKQFPIRGSAFVISAKDRARFDAFIRRQAPYDGWAAPPLCGNGSSCQDFSAVDLFEVQPTASIGWSDFLGVVYRAGELPVAATLDYNPPRVALVGPTGVSHKWLEAANLQDPAASSCKTGAFAPSDAVFCDLTDGDVGAGTLISGNFGWLWLNHFAPSCGNTMTQIRSFLTHQPGVRAAGNVMAIADATDGEGCPGQQLLGREVAGTGLETTNGDPGRRSSCAIRPTC